MRLLGPALLERIWRVWSPLQRLAREAEGRYWDRMLLLLRPTGRLCAFLSGMIPRPRRREGRSGRLCVLPYVRQLCAALSFCCDFLSAIRLLHASPSWSIDFLVLTF